MANVTIKICAHPMAPMKILVEQLEVEDVDSPFRRRETFDDIKQARREALARLAYFGCLGIGASIIDEAS